MKKIGRNIFLIFLMVAQSMLWPLSHVSAFTISEEREVGEKLLYSIRQAFPLIDDPDIVQYVTELGREVLTVAGIQFFDYRFHIIDSEEFNAFAAPSGLIFFYSGLIGAMKSEDEFVSVLAHEMAHVKKRHLASRMEKGQIVTLATLGLAIAALALGGGGSASQTLFAGSLAAGQSAQLHFSRENEEEADLLAYQWMQAMQRSPVGQKKMLETMRRIARYRSERLPQYLLTHPETESRLEYVTGLLETGGSADTSSSADNFAFLRVKYRILAASKDGNSLRTTLASIIADQQMEKEQRTMAKFGLAEIERLEGNFNRSRQLLAEVTAVYPQKTILLTDRAILEQAAGQTAEARRLLEEAIDREPRNLYAALALSKIYLASGELEKAESQLQAVLAEMKEYPAGYFELGRIAAARQQQGDSSMLVGKFNLYQGKLKIARENFRIALQDKGISAAGRQASEEGLQLLDRLENKSRR